jgi:hypothetical protein
MLRYVFSAVLISAATLLVLPAAEQQKGEVTIRTENYPRPPYSGATYYIYERDDEVICTKLEVCNKYDDCSVTYTKGAFKEEEDVATGEPYGKTDPVVIARTKQRKHVCLTKFKLIK